MLNEFLFLADEVVRLYWEGKDFKTALKIVREKYKEFLEEWFKCLIILLI